MKRLSFYIKYAGRSVLRDGQRSFFAVLCVAVGVAALVALQVLGASINDTLTGDSKGRAGGDIVVCVRGSSTCAVNPNDRLEQRDIDNINRLKQNGTISNYALFNANAVQIANNLSFPPTLYTVNPDTYPLYGRVEIVQPSGGNFRDLIRQPDAVIVSRNLWDKLNLKVGQTIEVSSGRNARAPVPLKVVGETSIDIPGVIFGSGQFFGFGYVSETTGQKIFDASDLRPSVIFVKTPPASRNEAIAKTIQGLRLEAKTDVEIQSNLAKGLDTFQQFLSYVGLVSLLVGGIGVINTMLVVIGRRTTEIATVKALGLKNRQAFFIFTLEATILGIVGSVTGVILGELLGLAIRGVAEGFFARELYWQLYPSPIIIGLLVGIITSAVFGFLPSYAAGKVRPAVVLRAQSSGLPKVSGFTSVLIVLLMTLALGFIGGFLLGNLVLGIILAFATFLLIMVMIMLLSLIIWLIGLLPAPFGASYKMAIRSFSRQRLRNATTVMVIVVGLFAISFITFVADSVKDTVRQTLNVDLGFNVVGVDILGSLTNDPTRAANVQGNLEKNVPGLQNLFLGNSTQIRINSLNGATTTPTGGNFQGLTETLSGRGYSNKGTGGGSGQKMMAGRNLTLADAGKPVVVVQEAQATQYGIKVGDKLQITSQPGGNPFQSGSGSRRGGTTIELEVIGILSSSNQVVNFESGWVAPFDVVAKLGSQFTLYYLLIDRAQLKSAVAPIQSALAGGFVVDLNELIDSFSRIVDQFLAFPLILSLLALFSGAILVANNVALTVLERRTEIGVLKAIGAKRRRVLGILLWESAFVGLLGGLLGIGMGILVAINSNRLAGGGGNTIEVTWSPTSALLLLLLGLGLAALATLLSAWGAVKEKPLVVLRYE